MNAKVLIDLVVALEACRNGKSNSATIRHLAKSVLGVAVSYTEAVAKELGPPLNKHGLTKDEVKLLKNDRKIMAIKSVRDRTGWGLKETKDFVEAAMAAMGIDGYKATGTQGGCSNSKLSDDYGSHLN